MLKDDELYTTLPDGTKSVTYEGPPHSTVDQLKILEVSRRRMLKDVQDIRNRIRLNEETQARLKSKG